MRKGELVAATSSHRDRPALPPQFTEPEDETHIWTCTTAISTGCRSRQVYLAGPIGSGGSEHNGPWRDEATAYLEEKGLIVVEPLEASKYHLYEVDEKDDTVAKILTERDRRFSMESDFILVNFLGSTARSIGCSMEIAWADAAGTTIVTVMDEEDEHNHPMILSTSDYTVDKLSKGCEIISSLAADRVEDM